MSKHLHIFPHLPPDSSALMHSGYFQLLMICCGTHQCNTQVLKDYCMVLESVHVWVSCVFSPRSPTIKTAQVHDICRPNWHLNCLAFIAPSVISSFVPLSDYFVVPFVHACCFTTIGTFCIGQAHFVNVKVKLNCSSMNHLINWLVKTSGHVTMWIAHIIVCSVELPVY